MIFQKSKKKIKEKEDRLNELDELLADPAVSTNSAKLNEISKETEWNKWTIRWTYGSMGDFIWPTWLIILHFVLIYLKIIL